MSKNGVTRHDRNNARMFFDVLSIVFFLLIIIGLFRQLIGHSEMVLTFSGIIDIFSRTPSINVATLPDLTIYGYWGPFDFLRSFLNVITGVGNFALFFSVSAINVLIFVLYLVTNLFLL